MNRKKAIVSGSGVGIGQGIAIELGKAGYDVAVHYNSSKMGAEETVRMIESFGGRARAFAADLTKGSEITRFFREAVAFLGGLDLYVNNSGVTKKVFLEDTTEEQVDFMVSIDFKSALLCVQAAAHYMIAERSHGSIVIITSNNAFITRPMLSLYGPLKAALVKLGMHAAMELAKDKIRVNTIAPGWTETPRVLQCDVEALKREIPLKRMATPSEIGRIVLFYASDAAASITGNCIIVDGGARLVDDKMENYGL